MGQRPVARRAARSPLPPGLEIPPGSLGQQVALALRLIGRYPSFRQLDDRGDLTPSLAPPELYRQVLAVAGM